MKYFVLILSIAFLPAVANAQDNCSPRNKADSTKTVMSGAKLSASDAAKLELTLADHPEDFSARAKLLGYYEMRQFSSQAAVEARRKHVLWIIANRPEEALAGSPFAEINVELDKVGYDQARKLWLDQTRSHPQSALIRGYAAQFFMLNDRAIAEDLLQQAHNLQPECPRWPDRLGHLYALQDGKEAAAKALAQFELAQSLDSSAPSKFGRMEYLAMSAFDAGALEKASRYANELLQDAPKSYVGWNYGNAVHHGNIVLGRIALTHGDVKAAEAFLLKAGATPGSPQLNSFGPNMALAKELLEKGEKDAVLQYFALCRKFWEMGGAQLDEWTLSVQANQIPDFGANLVY